MGNGRKTLAPCGHDGEVVVGTYVECLERCHLDEITFTFDDLDDTPMWRECPTCGSDDTEEFPGMQRFGSGTFYHCHPCGFVWT